ncbi:MAG: DUF899 family protein [candidate division Zixibacteria bacterium]|nr:DUF899 family protein [candidate division Zixibacteria bacterium]MDH3938497.1 DUF899 family protein [candidate division Zixibacteria bacterium]MDH4032751.1 DUF899 family protein [candidate division Zixibacteria bacterium]
MTRIAEAQPTELAKIQELQNKILEDKKKLAEMRRNAPNEEVSDYTFTSHDGSEIKLSDMFGTHQDLILIHNMGRGCAYCTLWADGFIGFTEHLENRAGFVVISKDEYTIQRNFHKSRGWNFKMHSSHNSTFNRDMGYEDDKGSQMPGISAFHKDANGKIWRTGSTWFGPGDDFCAVWPMFDLLKDGPNGWAPKFSY